MAATNPARPARPKAAPTHAGPVRASVPGRSSPRATSVKVTGGAVVTEARSTAMSTDAMPRTEAPGRAPQATTTSVALAEAMLATSKRRR